MSFLKKLFNNSNPLINCPRCLGKGHVDEADIIRLDRKLYWAPGPCALCDETGKVAEDSLTITPADTAYLTTELDKHERKRLREGDTRAWDRANRFQQDHDVTIAQVLYLYFSCQLSADQIAGLFLVNPFNEAISETDKKELIDYINEVISTKSGQ